MQIRKYIIPLVHNAEKCMKLIMGVAWRDLSLTVQQYTFELFMPVDFPMQFYMACLSECCKLSKGLDRTAFVS
jgi:hypothetical protein